MSKTKKIILVISLIAVFICSMCFTVSAESSFEALPITVTKIWSNNVDNNTYTQNAENYVTVTIPYHSAKSQFASIWQFNNNDNNNYYDYKFQFVFTIVEPKDFTCTLNGKSYEVKKDPTLVNTYYVEMDQVKLNTTQGRLDYSFTWSANTTGYMYVIAYYRLSDVNAILDNQNENTDKIIDNQNDNTQAIIDNQNALAEQEKNEIQQSGDDATEGAENVPNQSDGFINALGNLVSALSYNGTECKWTLPQVKMPQIANIVPEMVLIEQQDIDFGVWVQKMPTNILSLIQAVCTGALIVYCFKELYGTISYVFTLKGGGE